MTSEQRTEIPAGYTWKELPSVGRIPMPETWFFKEDSLHPFVRGFFISREQITAIEGVLAGTGGVISMERKTPKGFFETGLTLYVHSHASELFGRPPSLIAGGYIRGHDTLTPENDAVIEREGQLVVCKRFFSIGDKTSLGIKMPPKRFYVEATGNDNNDMLYMAIFENARRKMARRSKNRQGND